MATRIAVIKDGLLHQVGTPEELYFRPDNVFVASFIGSPSMNFVPGRLTGTTEEMTLDAGAWHIALPASRSRQLAPFANANVIVGIRPEDIHDPDFLPARVRGSAIQARVDVTEMMGNEKFLHLVSGTEKVLARVDPRTRARAGQDIQLMLDIDHLHVFDSKSEAAIAKIDIPEELREPPPAVTRRT